MNKFVVTSNLLNAQKLKTLQLNGKFLTIKDVLEETFQDKQKQTEEVQPVIELTETDQRWKPNKTAIKFLIKTFGAESNTWKNKKVQLAVVPTTYQGQPTEGIAIIGTQ